MPLLRPLDRRAGWALLAIGAFLALGVQYANPVGVPLYDGVVVQEPYRFLRPNSDQAGDPSSAADTLIVAGDKSPGIASRTSEQPPQAQLIALEGAFRLTPGATELKIAIEPLDPPVAPSTGAIAGNAYRFSVTDQAGTLLPIQACDGCISLVMRAPDGTGEATLMRLADGVWTAVETIRAGTTGLFQTNPKALGTMAVVTTGGSGPGGVGDAGFPSVVFLIGASVVVLFLAVMGLLVLRSRHPGPLNQTRAPGTRIPSKRKRPPRSPSRRSDR